MFFRHRTIFATPTGPAKWSREDENWTFRDTGTLGNTHRDLFTMLFMERMTSGWCSNDSMMFLNCLDGNNGISLRIFRSHLRSAHNPGKDRPAPLLAWISLKSWAESNWSPLNAPKVSCCNFRIRWGDIQSRPGLRERMCDRHGRFETISVSAKVQFWSSRDHFAGLVEVSKILRSPKYSKSDDLRGIRTW